MAEHFNPFGELKYSATMLKNKKLSLGFNYPY